MDLEQIRVDGGELYVHLWNSDDWSIQTEQELFEPDQTLDSHEIQDEEQMGGEMTLG